MDNITIDILLNEESKTKKYPFKIKNRIPERNKEFEYIKNNFDIVNKDININISMYKYINRFNNNVNIDENLLNEIKSGQLLIMSFECYTNNKTKEYFGRGCKYALVHNFDKIWTIHRCIKPNLNENEYHTRFILFQDKDNNFNLIYQYNNHDAYIKTLNFMEKRWYYYKEQDSKKINKFIGKFKTLFF